MNCTSFFVAAEPALHYLALKAVCSECFLQLPVAALVIVDFGTLRQQLVAMETLCFEKDHDSLDGLEIT